MSSGVSCPLCGALLSPAPRHLNREIQLSILHPRTVGNSAADAWTNTEYLVSNGSIISSPISGYTIKIVHAATGAEILLDKDYQVGRNEDRSRETEGDRVALKPCYPMHPDCWELFKTVASELGVEEKELPSYQHHLYRHFNSAAFLGYNLLWPHNYNLQPEEPLFYQVSRSSHAQNLGPHDLSYIDIIHYLQFKGNPFTGGVSSTYRYEIPQNDLGNNDLKIPDFLPLPLELTHRILCFLPASDITNLSTISFKKTLEIPDSVWKYQFDSGAELDFLRAQYSASDISHIPWRIKYEVAKKLILDNDLTAKNLKRRWVILRSLIHRITDVKDGREFNIEDIDPRLEMHLSELIFGSNLDKGLVCQAQLQSSANAFDDPPLRDGVQVRGTGSLESYRTKGMYVSYTGENRLRFVSGFRFVPGGEAIGIVNRHDEIYVPLDSPQAEIMAIWTATSKYGLRSIVAIPARTDFYFGDFDGVNVKRRFFSTGPAGINVEKLVLAIGISEVAILGIYSPNFIDSKNLDLQECFIQRYSWTPDIPPIYSKQRIAIEHSSLFYFERILSAQAKHNHIDLKNILFHEENITGFTCWLDENLQICGVEVSIGDRVRSSVLGCRTELSSGAPFEENETIIALDIFTEVESSILIGLIVYTFRGVIFKLIPKGQPDSYQKYTITAGEAKKIVGLLGVCDSCDLALGPKYPRLIALGILTSPSETSTVSLLNAEILSDSPRNPQPHSWDLTQDIPLPKELSQTIQPHGRYFLSSAPLIQCQTLECYLIDNHDRFRITGICVVYGKEPDTPKRSPSVLGRVCGWTSKIKSDIYTDQGEYILAADIFMKERHLYPRNGHEMQIVGIVFWTSSHRKISWGRCQNEYARKVIPLRVNLEEDLVLKWAYTERSDHLMIDREY